MLRATCSPAVTRGTAAIRGAFVAILWAAVLLGFLAVITVTHNNRSVFGVADLLFGPRAVHGTPIVVMLASLTAAALVGAGLGALAIQITAPVPVRAVVLVLVSFPALWVQIAVALSLIQFGREAARGHATSALLVPFESLLFAAYGMVIFIPVAAVPALLAALMLEGWTRPESHPQTGLARPAVRRSVARVVMALAAALAAFALRGWRK